MQLGLPAVLFIVFLILKLCNVIAWSWWWVTAPLWISAIIAVPFFLLFCWAAVGAASSVRKW